MNIIQKYWKWDEKYNSTDFHLSISIEKLSESGLITLIDEFRNEYCGKEGYPWIVKANKGEVESIYYRETFFPFITKELWEMSLDEFEEKVNEILEPLPNGDYIGDTLHVVFRDFFCNDCRNKKKSPFKLSSVPLL